jgi:hypothetical protein
MKINPAVNSTLSHAHHSPAKAARELLQSRPDLAEQPFGQLVSKLARGEEIAPAPTTPDTAEPPEQAIDVVA